MHADGYCMAGKSKDKEAAWKFIEYANSPKGQEIVARTGRTVPSLRSVAELAAFLDPTQKPANSQVWLDAVPTLRTVPVMSNWPAIEDAASKEVERAFYGQATVEEAAASAAALTQSMFERGRPIINRLLDKSRSSGNTANSMAKCDYHSTIDQLLFTGFTNLPG